MEDISESMPMISLAAKLQFILDAGVWRLDMDHVSYWLCVVCANILKVSKLILVEMKL
jgi:hypothetical protein